MALQGESVRLDYVHESQRRCQSKPMKIQRKFEYHGTNQGNKGYDNLTQRKMISTINSLYDVLGSVAL